MFHWRKSNARRFLYGLPVVLRALAVVSLVILIFSLIVPSIFGDNSIFSIFTPLVIKAGSGEYTSHSLNTSPPPPDPDPPGPTHSPPGQFHSPPGQFHSPPGQFHSPPGPFHSPPSPNPGGKGTGRGPARHIDLHFYDNSMVPVPEATGRITIYGTAPKVHPNWPDTFSSINYAISKLPCQDNFLRSDIDPGRWFYALYLITEYGERIRLQSFNPGCPDNNHNSWVYIRQIPEAILLEGDITFEVHVEIDDSGDTPIVYPEYDCSLVLSGHDSGR